MREKLIEILRKSEWDDKLHWLDLYDLVDSADSFADYLLDNGVIVLPCKVGDKVWIIDEGDVGCEPYALDVPICAVGRDEGGAWVRMDLPLGFNRSPYVGAFEIGKTVFLTREDAEAALKGAQR